MIAGDGIAMRPFTESLPMALLQAREATMRRFRPLLTDHDLTEQQWRVLRALAAVDEPTAVGELADHTFLLAPSLSRILTNLEGRNLVERRAVAHDQRRATIALTATGRAVVRRIAPSSETVYNQIEAEYGAVRLRKLLADLHELAALDIGAQVGAIEGEAS
ncbi:MAG: homoprotocatechuate degradation operon regulator HpaR [Acidimicrobiia bacterium]|nr:homoprotocatechuate degradation operon regulator HpaR [Acidimicrobiia bacterium]